MPITQVCRGKRFQEHALKNAVRIEVRHILVCRPIKGREIVSSPIIELIYPSVDDIQARKETEKGDCAQDPSIPDKRIFGQVLPEYI